MKPVCLKCDTASGAGYGLALLIVFVLSTVMLGSSFQMISHQASRAPMTASIDNLIARETAASAFEAVRSDILSKLNAKTTVDTSYRYPAAGSNTISMPGDAANLGGALGAVGSYYATMTQARGNSYLVKVTATAGNSTVSVSRLLQLQTTCSPDTTFIGRNAGDVAGLAVSSAGDVNGDGYEDLLVGAATADGGGADSGEVYLIFGRSTTGWRSLTDSGGNFNLNNLSDPNGTVRFLGRNAGEQAGSAVSAAGDVNNDGYDDILIAAQNADGGGTDSGEVYLILGRSTTNWQTLTDANGDFNLDNMSDANGTIRFLGRNEVATGDKIGRWVNGAGDVNNDGYADILIGTEMADGGGTTSGEVYLVLGRSTANWQTLTDAAGDFNLDNMSDANGTVRFIGRNTNERAGGASGAGDVNNDGYDDVLVAAWDAGGGGVQSGEVYIILGRSTANWQTLTDAAGNFNLDNLSDANNTVRLIGRNANDSTGQSISSAGDVNRDGYDDILMGAQVADGGGIGVGTGEVYLILGRSTANWQTLTDAAGDFNLDNMSDANGTVRFIGRNMGDQLGFAVNSAGDTNGDGYSDILISAWQADGGGADSGEIYLVLGRSTANWQALTDVSGNFSITNTSDANGTVRFLARNAGDRLSQFIGSAGDANGDGLPDIFIGARNADTGGADAGEAYLILGRKTASWQALTDASGDYNLDNVYVSCSPN
jgi:hypothetical protein